MATHHSNLTGNHIIPYPWQLRTDSEPIVRKEPTDAELSIEQKSDYTAHHVTAGAKLYFENSLSPFNAILVSSFQFCDSIYSMF